MFYSVFTFSYNQLQNRVGVKTQTVSRFLRQNYKLQKCRKGNTSARAYARARFTPLRGKIPFFLLIDRLPNFSLLRYAPSCRRSTGVPVKVYPRNPPPANIRRAACVLLLFSVARLNVDVRRLLAVSKTNRLSLLTRNTGSHFTSERYFPTFSAHCFACHAFAILYHASHLT